jgi:hypothetical protein
MTTLWGSTGATGALVLAFQQGLVERAIQAPLSPMLLWSLLTQQEQFPLSIGETLHKTRDGLITPSARSTVTILPGNDPPTVSRSRERYSLTMEEQGSSMTHYLPNGSLAAVNSFLVDVDRLVTHGAMTLNRIRRDVFLAAYGGGNSFATAAGSAATALVVQDATGFDTVMVNGEAVPVSATNVGTLLLAGTSRTYTAVNLGTNTITLSSAQTWAQYDSVVRSDATPVFRQASRATDRLIVAGDVATLATFRSASMWMRGQNVPGVDGSPTGDYVCFINSDIEDQLMQDSEFRTAVNGAGLQPAIANGMLGRYAGVQFYRVPKSESAIIAAGGAYQANIHRSVMFGGGGAVIEGYINPADLITSAGPLVNHTHMRQPLANGMQMVVRAPQDALGKTVLMSWNSALGWSVPSDINNGTGNAARFKRGVVIHTAGPAA